MKTLFRSGLQIFLLFAFLAVACAQATPYLSTDEPQVVTQEPGLSPLSEIILSLPTTTSTSSVTHQPAIETPPVSTEQPVTQTATRDSTISTQEQTCSNRAEFIQNLTISDNTVLKPGQFFAKIWRVKNIGTCTWTPSYSLIFAGGDPMGALQNVPLSQYVPPSEMIDLRLDLVAPTPPNSYFGSWMIQDQSGYRFGIGPQSDQPLTVVITVSSNEVGNERIDNFFRTDSGCT